MLSLAQRWGQRSDQWGLELGTSPRKMWDQGLWAVQIRTTGQYWKSESHPHTQQRQDLKRLWQHQVGRAMWPTAWLIVDAQWCVEWMKGFLLCDDACAWGWLILMKIYCALWINTLGWYCIEGLRSWLKTVWRRAVQKAQTLKSPDSDHSLFLTNLVTLNNLFNLPDSVSWFVKSSPNIITLWSC